MTKQTFYFKQGYHNITILDNNHIAILAAIRSVNWFGRIKTVIKMETKEIVSTHYSFLFFKNFKVVENTTNLKLSFINGKDMLTIENHTIERKYQHLIGTKFSILFDNVKVCDLSFDILKVFNDITEIEFNEDIPHNSPIIKYVLIYLCLTEHILFS